MAAVLVLMVEVVVCKMFVSKSVFGLSIFDRLCRSRVTRHFKVKLDLCVTRKRCMRVRLSVVILYVGKVQNHIKYLRDIKPSPTLELFRT